VLFIEQKTGRNVENIDAFEGRAPNFLVKLVARMISRLYISNFALIREMEVTFPGSLTVITGETGAGKSIFLEALGLALGRRADLSVLDNNEKKCVVEAEFDTAALDLDSLFELHGLERDNRVILRREIGSEGRSRSFVNDSVVPLNTLKEFAEQLIDIHSQHQTLLLNQGRFQLDILDAFASTQELFQRYRSEYQKLSSLKKELELLEQKENTARKELDYHNFLYKELDEANIVSGEQVKLEEESQKLGNAEGIKSILASTAALLGAGESPALTALAQARQSLSSILKFDKSYADLAQRLNSSYIELKDIYSELEKAGEALYVDNARLDEISSKLDKLARLIKKHGVRSEADLLEIKGALEIKLEEFGSLESVISQVRKGIENTAANCFNLASELSSKRKASVSKIEKETKLMLADLAMPNATFKIAIETEEICGPSGIDRISFLFSANKGVEPSEISKVASGGELSRLMLCLKSLLAGKKKLPTIIFDEIDTGVSGEVAAKIGRILHKMSSDIQVITITHLPQMASRGQHHLFVYKKDEAKRTRSFIKALSEEERIQEIAKMLSTGQPGESALQNARELLGA
jgi:DNA repair protein RecN (Recombination protein N)